VFYRQSGEKSHVALDVYDQSVLLQETTCDFSQYHPRELLMRTEPGWLDLGVRPRTVIYSPPAKSPLLWSQPAMRRNTLLLGFVLSLLWSLLGCGNKETGKGAAPPEVEVAPVVQQDVPLYTECISTLDGYVNAQIQPQVTGYLLKQNYAEGTVVHKGEVLFEIDPRPFEAALAQAEGQLAQSEAQLGKAKLDVARDTPLAKQSAIPQAQLDNDIQANAAAQAVTAAVKAQVDQARLNLSFTKVRSLRRL